MQTLTDAQKAAVIQFNIPMWDIPPNGLQCDVVQFKWDTGDVRYMASKPLSQILRMLP